MKNFFSNLFKNITTKVEPEEIRLKDYFWKLDDYIEPKVRIYDFQSKEYRYSEYCLMEKIDQTRLRITYYNSEFDKTGVLIQVFKEDGVYVEYRTFKMFGIPDKDIITLKQNTFVFPFLDSEAKMYEEFEYESFIDAPVVVKQNTTREFINHKEGNPELLKTKGVMQRTAYSIDGEKLKEYHFTIETHFEKGLGEVFRSQADDLGYFNTSYYKTISVKEFEELKKSRTDNTI